MLRYKEIKQALLEMTATMSPGDRLPSRTKLCRALDTTRTTLDKAIKELVADHVLISQKGSGTSVAAMIEGSAREVENWGVIVPNIMEQIYSSFLRGVENVAQQNGINIILCNSDNDGDKQEQYIKRLMVSGVSGFIIVPVVSYGANESNRLYESLVRSKLPFVFCNRCVEGVLAPIVKSNDFYGGYIAAKHLIENGYRKIAFISHLKYRTSLDRCQGYMAALLENDISINRKYIIMPREHETLDTAKAMAEILSMSAPPDAFFCFNDYIAKKVCDAITETGLRISDDIGIVGYDNIDVCEKYEPKISSVANKSLEIGEKAAVLLVEASRGENPSSNFEYYLFQPRLIPRGSSLGKKQSV